MTWRLVTGQLRANRGYFVWTVSLLTLLVAVLTYIVVAGATQAEISARQAVINGSNLDRAGYAVITSDPNSELENSVTPEKLRDMIDSSPPSTAVAGEILASEPLGEYDSFSGTGFLALAKYGGLDHQWLLADGRLPAVQGEIALAANIARDLGVNIGDEIELYGSRTGPDGYTAVDVPYSFTVVGTSASQSLAGFDVYNVPGALLAWAETEPGGVLNRGDVMIGGAAREGTWVDLRWDGSSPALDPYLEYTGGYWGTEVELPQSTAVWMTLAMVLIAAMIIMSFAVGRAQAAARTQWIATARTLGATRGYIAWSTVLETLVMAVVAMGIGVVVGVLAGQAHLSLARAASGLAFAPERVSLHWAIIPTVAIATLLVAVAIAAVPAFWASRVSPVAALKPVNDVTEAELSRRVSPHWLWIPTVLGIAFIVLGNRFPAFPDGTLITLGVLMAGVGVIGLVIEATRAAIPWTGRRMAKSPRATILTAGDTLAGRPRLAVAPALISLAAMGGFTLFTLGRAANAQWQSGEFGWFAYAPEWVAFRLQGFLDGATVLAVVLGAFMVQLVAAAIFVAHRASTSREAAARRALGLSVAGETRAQWWQQMMPQAIGATFGVFFGAVIFALWEALQGFVDESYFSLAVPYAAMAIGASFAAVAVLLLTAALTAWLVARIGRKATPLARLNAAT